MDTQYIHINYQPENGWVLSIMSKLLNSSNAKLRNAFDQWSETALKELGFAVTTRMHMLGCSIRRLNKRVAELRGEIGAETSQLDACLDKGHAFQLKSKDLPYELLLDMDSFIFETRSLYEILGKFLVTLFQTLFSRKVTEGDLQAILSSKGINTRWIDELREGRKLFFHETAPWLAVQVHGAQKTFDPVLLKRHVLTFDDPNTFVEFQMLRQIYDGFVNSITELHRFVLEQIRLAESSPSEELSK